jgi:RNA polymerase sigma-70 factor (ECF subfamily)
MTPEEVLNADQPNSDKMERFVALVTQYQPRVFLFILSLVPNRADAEEILQETNLVLWRRFDEYRPGSDFRAWAFQVAHYKVLSFLDARGRDKLRFGQEFLDRIAVAAASAPDDWQPLQDALCECVAKLSAKDLDLVQRRYRRGGSSQQVAEEVGRSVAAIYKALTRIRRTLRDCVRRALARREHA